MYSSKAARKCHIDFFFCTEGGKKSPVPKKDTKGGKEKDKKAPLEVDDEFVPPPPPLEVNVMS